MTMFGGKDLKILIEPSLKEVLKNIRETAKRANRDPSSITLVVVTKEVGIKAAEAVIELGIRDVGENRVKDLMDKMPLFESKKVRVHLVGTLQKNKINKILGRVHLIHSVEDYELAEAISDRFQRFQPHLENVDILLQVNISKETTKHGVAPREVFRTAEKIALLKGLCLRGLMTIAPFIPAEECRPYFVEMRELFENLKQRLKLEYFDTLSMGMSNDYIVAIEEGATMVRIGSAIFKGVIE